MPQVRAPYLAPKSLIDRFVEEHADFIAERRKRISVMNALESREQDCRAEAARLLPQLAEYYGTLMGVKASYIRITSAKTRFGSCNAQNGICFSWRLMLYDLRGVEYVVVHELAHIKQKNHSAAFYAEINKVMPDYKRRRELLRSPLIRSEPAQH